MFILISQRRGLSREKRQSTSNSAHGARSSPQERKGHCVKRCGSTRIEEITAQEGSRSRDRETQDAGEEEVNVMVPNLPAPLVACISFAPMCCIPARIYAVTSISDVAMILNNVVSHTHKTCKPVTSEMSSRERQ